MVKRGRLSPEDKDKRMELIGTALDYGAFAESDVVIEAVFEEMALKKNIFGALDQAAKPGALLASNSSTLDVTEIARSTRRPGDVVGTHFFSPANVMPLLEVIRTELTGATAIRTAMDLAKLLRKTPVLAKVCYGFVGNRMMEGYAREAERIVLEGATPLHVDTVLEQWGMAMGILAVFDMAGVDVGVNVHKANADRYPPDPTYYQADFALVEAGRFGQKSGKGYYRYEPGIAAVTKIQRRSRCCVPVRSNSAFPSARTRIRRSWIAASTRCSTKGSGSSKKASCSAPPISMWCGPQDTASHAIAADPCSTRNS